MFETAAQPRDEATGQFALATEGLAGRELTNAEASYLTAIVAHEKPAVRNLFGLVKRMHDHIQGSPTRSHPAGRAFHV